MLQAAGDGAVLFVVKKPGNPVRMSREKSGLASEAFAATLMRARALSSANGRPPVASEPRSNMSSSSLPLSRMRQSHGVRSAAACCVRILVVQLLVTALAH